MEPMGKGTVSRGPENADRVVWGATLRSVVS